MDEIKPVTLVTRVNTPWESEFQVISTNIEGRFKNE